MTIHLPEDLERYVQSQVQSGYFSSEEEAIAEAVRLLRQVRQAPASARPAQLSQEELDRQMVQAGFLAGGHAGPASPRPGFEPVTIEGEPLSETIIRERR